MNEEDRQKKLKEQSEDQYRSIGKFAVKFEHVCEAIHSTMLFMLHNEGIKNQKVIQVLLANHTAEPLRVLFESLISVTQSLSQEESKIINSVLKRFQELTSKRNDIIHGTWYIGWAATTDTDFSTAIGLKHHRNKAGTTMKRFEFSTCDFDVLTQEAEALAAIIQRLGSCFTVGFSITSNLKSDENGFVSVP